MLWLGAGDMFSPQYLSNGVSILVQIVILECMNVFIEPQDGVQVTVYKCQTTFITFHERLKNRIFNINNNLIRVMYNCFEIENGPMWISWANSLYTGNL